MKPKMIPESLCQSRRGWPSVAQPWLSGRRQNLGDPRLTRRWSRIQAIRQQAFVPARGPFDLGAKSARPADRQLRRTRQFREQIVEHPWLEHRLVDSIGLPTRRLLNNWKQHQALPSAGEIAGRLRLLPTYWCPNSCQVREGRRDLARWQHRWRGRQVSLFTASVGEPGDGPTRPRAVHLSASTS